jgi:acyl-CoA oxidase
VRRQFAAPGKDREIVVNDYLVHQRKLLPALATSYALHFAQGELVETMHDVQYQVHVLGNEIDEESQRELESRAAGLKVAQTWHATRTIQMAREACGGAGYLSENRLPALKADTDVFTTFEGDNTVLLQLVAKELLTSYRDHFGELDMLGTIRFVAGQAFGSVLERSPLIARLLAAAGRDEDAGWDDRGWQLSLLDFRQRHLTDGLARRLRKAADADDPFAVFNACQDHLLATAQAHVDRMLAEAFVAAVEDCPDAAVRQLLERVCDLYVLSTVDAERAWYIEHGRLSASRTKQLTGEINRLCAELRPHALTLIDGFGVPDVALRIPMLQD